MLGYSDISTKPQRRCQASVWTLLLAMLLFALTLTVVALLEAGRLQSHENQPTGDVFIVSRLWSHFRAAGNETGDEVAATVERIARDATNASHVTSSGRSNNYYEEQRAVVVNEENTQPLLAQRQDVFGPPQVKTDSLEPDSYYDAADDYGGQQSEEEPYFDGEGSSRSNEQTSSADSSDEARAAQARSQDSYYGQWQHASRTPAAVNNNKKLQLSSNRAPYPAYDDVYDYPMGFQPRPQAQAIAKQVVPTPATAVANAPAATESTLVIILKSLKQLWDLYQAVTSAWGAVSERHQQSAEQLKKERLEKQRLRQQQLQKTRVNSKKPPRIESDKFAQRNQTKKAKGTSTTTTTTSTTTSDTEVSEEATATPVKAEPLKGAKGDATEEHSVRGLRQKREPETASTDVGEGRYIKGDPLKGYYDFVITEGSYKFWAVFQVGTALLIIYSTFAAIYYSKVNPLTSDYDYQDYLGAGRSLSGGDDDFVDDSDSSATTSAPPTSRFMNWLPRTAHSLKFILDAIDKLPLDQDQKVETGWSTGRTDTASSDKTARAMR